MLCSVVQCSGVHVNKGDLLTIAQCPAQGRALGKQVAALMYWNNALERQQLDWHYILNYILLIIPLNTLSLKKYVHTEEA